MKDYDEILVALRRITRAIDLHSKSLQKKTGLTTSQLLVMEIINKLGSPSPSTIAREMVLSQATVTTLLDRLTKNQLVVRVKSDQDKRSVAVDLTERGKELVSHAPELLQAGEQRAFETECEVATVICYPRRLSLGQHDEGDA
jgi:DNA-binding MarR family transcriptional regulator